MAYRKPVIDNFSYKGKEIDHKFISRNSQCIKDINVISEKIQFNSEKNNYDNLLQSIKKNPISDSLLKQDIKSKDDLAISKEANKYLQEMETIQHMIQGPVNKNQIIKNDNLDKIQDIYQKPKYFMSAGNTQQVNNTQGNNNKRQQQKYVNLLSPLYERYKHTQKNYIYATPTRKNSNSSYGSQTKLQDNQPININQSNKHSPIQEKNEKKMERLLTPKKIQQCKEKSYIKNVSKSLLSKSKQKGPKQIQSLQKTPKYYSKNVTKILQTNELCDNSLMQQIQYSNSTSSSDQYDDEDTIELNDRKQKKQQEKQLANQIIQCKKYLIKELEDSNNKIENIECIEQYVDGVIHQSKYITQAVDQEKLDQKFQRFNPCNAALSNTKIINKNSLQNSMNQLPKELVDLVKEELSKLKKPQKQIKTETEEINQQKNIIQTQQIKDENIIIQQKRGRRRKKKLDQQQKQNNEESNEARKKRIRKYIKEKILKRISITEVKEEQIIPPIQNHKQNKVQNDDVNRKIRGYSFQFVSQHLSPGRNEEKQHLYNIQQLIDQSKKINQSYDQMQQGYRSEIQNRLNYQQNKVDNLCYKNNCSSESDDGEKPELILKELDEKDQRKLQRLKKHLMNVEIYAQKMKTNQNYKKLNYDNNFPLPSLSQYTHNNRYQK